MAWETRGGNGRYYTRSRRVHGKVAREYIGTGPVAELAAGMDALARSKRRENQRVNREEIDRLENGETAVTKVFAETNLLARASLLSAGYHQHARSEWRRRLWLPQ